MRILVIVLISLLSGFTGAMFCITIAKILLKIVNRISPPNVNSTFLDKSNNSGDKGNGAKIRVNDISCLEQVHEYISKRLVGFYSFTYHHILNITQRSSNPRNNRKEKDTDGDIKKFLPVHRRHYIRECLRIQRKVASTDKIEH